MFGGRLSTSSLLTDNELILSNSVGTLGNVLTLNCKVDHRSLDIECYQVWSWFFFVDVDVGKQKIADGEREHGHRDGEAVEESAGDLLVVEPRDDEVWLQA